MTAVRQAFRVAMVTTHPIQYQVPWLRMLSQRSDVDLHVYFAMIPDAVEQGREFGVAFTWDLPLLEGYEYSVLENVASEPSVTAFAGCDTPEIVSRLAKGRYDAVIVNGWGTRTALQALWGCMRAGIPCVVRGEANGLRPRARWKQLAHRLLLRRYAAALVIGTRNREYYRSLGYPAARIFHTPYCVDNRMFADAAASWRSRHSQAELRTRFGLAPDRVTYLFSGKLVEKKRPADLIVALAKLFHDGSAAAQVLVVGDGPLRPALEKQAEGLPVKFAGFLNQSEITAAYAASDCLVLPSDHGETWGLVVNEAMASGLPALVSDQVGCAVDLVSPGETGDVFPCGDTQRLAQLLSHGSAQPEGLRRMGEQAQARVVQDFSFERVVEGVVSALKHVIGEN